MARIAGVDIPRDKPVGISLRYVYGVGPTLAQRVLSQARVSPQTRVRDLTDEEVGRIREVVERNLRVEGELRREVGSDIRRLMEVGCYRGFRHQRNLPVRGQRTRTNARTKRGARKTVAGRGHKRGGVGRK